MIVDGTKYGIVKSGLAANACTGGHSQPDSQVRIVERMVVVVVPPHNRVREQSCRRSDTGRNCRRVPGARDRHIRQRWWQRPVLGLDRADEQETTGVGRVMTGVRRNCEAPLLAAARASERRMVEAGRRRRGSDGLYDRAQRRVSFWRGATNAGDATTVISNLPDQDLAPWVSTYSNSVKIRDEQQARQVENSAWYGRADRQTLASPCTLSEGNHIAKKTSETDGDFHSVISDPAANGTIDLPHGRTAVIRTWADHRSSAR